MSRKGWAEYARLASQTRPAEKASAAAILLFLLDKDQQEELTTEQRKNLRSLVAELKKL